MTFVLTNAALADLTDIWDYTIQHWGETQARSYTLKIKQTCHALCSDMYPNQSAEDVRPGYRRALVGRHMIFFQSTETEIVIVRILEIAVFIHVVELDHFAHEAPPMLGMVV